MKNIFIVGLSVAVGLAVACGDDDSSTPAPAGTGSSSSSSSSGEPTSSSSSSSSSSGAPSGGGAITGTLGGKPFSAVSSYFFKRPSGALDLFFSDKAGACQDAKDGKLQPDETAFQIYALGAGNGGSSSENAAAVGANTTQDAKYAHVIASCASGSPLGDDSVDKSSSVKTDATVTLTVLSDNAVGGSLSVTLDDGSTVEGTFLVNVCPSTTQEAVTCR